MGWDERKEEVLLGEDERGVLVPERKPAEAGVEAMATVPTREAID